MTIGENIKKLREAAGLTQESIFKQSGLSVSYQSQIENGANPGKKTIATYCEVLGVDEMTVRFGERMVEPVITGDSLDDRLAREIWSAYSPEQKRIAVRLLHDVATKPQTVDHNS